jgi:MFS family permease
VQRRTIRVLFVSQVLGGLGVAAGIAVGVLLAQDVAGSATLAGLAQTATVLGAALAAVPLARLMSAHGRRRGLATGYTVGGVGAVLAIVAAVLDSFPMLLAGLLLFGASTASSMQARFAATDLAAPAHRGRDLSIIVWASTTGSVLGPNLIEPGGTVAGALQLPLLAGPYVFSVIVFGLTVLLLLTKLRPDPLLLARESGPQTGRVPPTRIAHSMRTIAASRSAVLALGAIAVAHTIMISVMVMTPVHMHHGGAELSVIGLVISVHVAGMYALSPVVGWLADRLGRVPMILVGVGILGIALVLAGAAPAGSSPGLAVGLFLLGVGWSFNMVAGSTLLTESLPATERPAAQGAADLVMGLCGAVGGAVGGVVVGWLGFGALAIGVAPLLMVVLVLAGARRTLRPI